MKLTDIEQLGAHVKKLTTETRATGPRTEAGKFKAALNATKHGLAGKNLLLPGEDPKAYTEKLDAIFVALMPQNDAEAEVVALVGDDLHKLDRLARIERGITLGRIEELLALSGSGASAGSITIAITMLGQALTSWVAEPMPVEKTTEFSRRYLAMSDAISYLENIITDIPADTIDSCNETLDAVRGKKDDTDVPMTTYMAMFHVARELMTVLLDRGQREDAIQDEMRAAIANIALPDEAELKKLARYRSMLELSLQRRLALLDQLRKLTAGNPVGEKDAEKAREYRVKLRVVA